MLVVEIVLAAVVVFGVAVVAMGYGGSITHFKPDWPGRGLPSERTLRAHDVSQLRFSLALRGYRMEEVDTAIDRLALEIAQRDARIEELTGRPYEAPIEPTVSSASSTSSENGAPSENGMPGEPARPAEPPQPPQPPDQPTVEFSKDEPYRSDSATGV